MRLNNLKPPPLAKHSQVSIDSNLYAKSVLGRYFASTVSKKGQRQSTMLQNRNRIAKYLYLHDQRPLILIISYLQLTHQNLRTCTTRYGVIVPKI